MNVSKILGRVNLDFLSGGIPYAVVALAVLLIVEFSLIFFYAPIEATMGIAQKIFYLHVPLAWSAFLAFFGVFIASVIFLLTGSRRWDRNALACAEIGVLFTTLVLLSGSAWGKVAWGAWWIWDVRLTSTLILWFIYLGYLIIRGLGRLEEQVSRLSAVIGIIGFLDVPLIYLSVEKWRSLHPPRMVFIAKAGEDVGLSPEMFWTLLFSVTFFTLFTFILVHLRARLHKAIDEVEGLKVSALQLDSDEAEEIKKFFSKVEGGYEWKP